MCGRYYVDDKIIVEIAKIAENVNEKIETGWKKDIHPSEDAQVFVQKDHCLRAENMCWGFPSFQGKNLLINARAEGVLEKKTFRESILHRRCVIPAKGFYEWNIQKEKYSFEKMEGVPVLFMAGCFKQFQERNCFVILTTAANPSVSPIHDRMPLILERREVEEWLFYDESVEFLLHKTPGLLTRQTNYEQMKLF